MSEENGRRRLEMNETDRLLREAPEPRLGHSLYPGVRARIADRKGAISTPFRLAGGLAMAAGILLGVYLGDTVSPELESGPTDDESVALLAYGEGETLDTAFLTSFTDENLR
ncbi:MAG: hypothetical protein HKN20_07020 [Gemmatimonadetes bacterium]|nr:hypothetical protein [Gemmatimonadota bacterium]